MFYLVRNSISYSFKLARIVYEYEIMYENHCLDGHICVIFIHSTFGNGQPLNGHKKRELLYAGTIYEVEILSLSNIFLDLIKVLLNYSFILIYASSFMLYF